MWPTTPSSGRFGNSWHWALPLWGSSLFFGIFCTGGEQPCWVWKQGKEPEITRPQRASGTRSICEHSVPKMAYLGYHQAKTCELNACQISRTEEPTIWVEPEETGITEVKCSRNQNSPRTSKLHQDDVFSSVRFGFLLFLFSLSSFPLFPVPLGLAPPPWPGLLKLASFSFHLATSVSG